MIEARQVTLGRGAAFHETTHGKDDLNSILGVLVRLIATL